MAVDLSDIAATTDIYCITDFRPEMPMVSGRVALLHRLARRLQTPRGRFPWWPNFGTDLRLYLLSKTPAGVVAAAIENECLKDEQVQDVSATCQFLDSTRKLVAQVTVSDAEGPFVFTLEISTAAEMLIELQAA